MNELLESQRFEVASEFEDEFELGRRGQAGRNPAQRFAAILKREGFLPSSHFVERFLQRILSQGARFDPRTFRQEFLRAKHYRQTRPGYNTRFAVVRGIPIVYRPGGENANRIVLVTVLAHGTKLPPVTPASAPRQRESEVQVQSELTGEFEAGAGLQSDRFKNNARLQHAFNNSPVMRRGEQGEAVRILQQALIDAGFPMPNSTQGGQRPPDGIYGSETVTIVQKFQLKYGLQPDGIVGRATLGKLDALFSGNPPKPVDPIVPPVTPLSIPTSPKDWQYLINFRPSTSIQAAINSRFSNLVVSPPFIHFIEDAKGLLNLDYYPVLVTALPSLPSTSGRAATPTEFLSHIRLNLNRFIDTTVSEFSPYDATVDQPRWLSSTPLGAVIHIDMRVGSQWANPDDGSVVVSEFRPNYWIFSTLWTPADFAHPVSGNRQFGFQVVQNPNNPGQPAYLFYTKGADRPTTRIDSAGSSVIFKQADKLWRSLQDGIANYANANGGSARKLDPTAQRLDWEPIKRVYFAPTTPRL